MSFLGNRHIKLLIYDKHIHCYNSSLRNLNKVVLVTERVLPILACMYRARPEAIVFTN
jgi:hypothetical protein